MAVKYLRTRWWLWLGRNRARRKDYDGALPCFIRVIQLRPNDASALANIANCFDHQGLYTEAVEYYDRALQAQSDFADVHARLGLILWRQQRYQESVDSLHRAFRIQPSLRKSAAFLLALARSLGNIGRVEDALSVYKETAEYYPTNAEAFAGIGWALWSSGDSKEAVSPLRSAIKLDPNFASAYDILGKVLRDLGNDAESVPIWQRLIELKPDDCGARASLGWALGGLGKYREAISELKRVLTMDAGFPAHYAIGLYHLYLNEYPAAIEAEEVAVLQQPDADAYCVIGAALLGQGEYERAIAVCQQALNLNPEHHLAWHNMGEAYMATGQLEKAVTSFERAVEIVPATAESHLQLGIAYLKLGNWSEAQNQCRFLRALDSVKADELEATISTNKPITPQ